MNFSADSYGAIPKHIIIIRKTISTLGMAMFLMLLSVFGGVGYKLNAIDEVTFVKHTQYGYADAVFYVDIVFNPILHPSYWLKSMGSFQGNVSMMYIPEGYQPGEFGGPIWGLSEHDRYDTYVTFLITLGIGSDFAIIIVLTALIELLKCRKVYFAIFSGMIGFAIASVLGLLVGIIVGFILMAIIVVKRPSKICRFIEEIKNVLT